MVSKKKVVSFVVEFIEKDVSLIKKLVGMFKKIFNSYVVVLNEDFVKFMVV